VRERIRRETRASVTGTRKELTEDLTSVGKATSAAQDEADQIESDSQDAAGAQRRDPNRPTRQTVRMDPTDFE
jgi:hypothetical protein